MNYETDCEHLDPAYRRQFSTTLRENLESIIESIQIIQFECDVVGDKYGAGFFKGVAATVRAFTSIHAPFGECGNRRSRL